MINDESPLNTIQLAKYMLCCRATIGAHKRQGYSFEFGTRTTAAHYKQWLRQTGKGGSGVSREWHEVKAHLGLILRLVSVWCGAHFFTRFGK